MHGVVRDSVLLGTSIFNARHLNQTVFEESNAFFFLNFGEMRSGKAGYLKCTNTSVPDRLFIRLVVPTAACSPL